MDEPTDPEGGPEESPRAPKRGDLSRLCAELNRQGALYIVVGGFAIIEAGFPRLTGDIDLLVDTSPENERSVYEALRSLPDQAVNELNPGDVERFTVVRVADEVVVDLMKSACGIRYAEAREEVVYREVEGVRIPFASPMLLWRMKQTVREKDAADRAFLRELLEAEGARPQSEPGAKGVARVAGWFRRLFGKS